MPRRGYQVDVSAAKGASANLLPANPHRDYLVLACGGPLPCRFGFGVAPNQTSGLLLTVNNGPITLTAAEYGDIITKDINIFGYDDGSAGTSTTATALTGEVCGMMY